MMMSPTMCPKIKTGHSFFHDITEMKITPDRVSVGLTFSSRACSHYTDCTAAPICPQSL